MSAAPVDPIAWEETLPTLRPSSPAWRAVTIATWGRRPLSAADEALFVKLSGGRPVPDGGSDAVLVVAGRRGGKSETIARWSIFEGLHGGHEVSLAPGQTGVLAVVCPEQKHAREVIGYAKGLAALPTVKRHVARVTEAAVTFKSGLEIRVVTANELAVAATYVMIILDEAARLPGDEAVMPDKAVIASMLPGMAPIKGAPRRKLVAITSAFIDSGWAYETDRDNFGRPDADVLVLRGSSEAFNPNIDRAWLERERRKDATSAAREYGDGDTPPEWQPAVTEGWFGPETIERCIDRGRGNLPPAAGATYYVAVDAAFSRDNFGIAVVRNEWDRGTRRTVVVYVDAFKPPAGGSLSPRDCVERTIAVLQRYGQSVVSLDQFCAPMLIESFADRGVAAHQIPWTGSGIKSKAARFRDVREGMRDGLVRLPDDRALRREFHRVRGHLTQSGHEAIEAIGKGVDDRVSAVVMACSVAREGAERGRAAAAWEAKAQAVLDMLEERDLPADVQAHNQNVGVLEGQNAHRATMERARATATSDAAKKARDEAHTAFLARGGVDPLEQPRGRAHQRLGQWLSANRPGPPNPYAELFRK